jgi:hypothetical protein
VSRGGKENQEPRNATMQDQGSVPGIRPSSMEGSRDLLPGGLPGAASFTEDADCLCPEPVVPKASTPILPATTKNRCVAKISAGLTRKRGCQNFFCCKTALH